MNLVDAAAETSDDRVEEQGIDGRPSASELAVRGSEDVGQGREEEAEREGQEEPDEAWVVKKDTSNQLTKAWRCGKQRASNQVGLVRTHYVPPILFPFLLQY